MACVIGTQRGPSTGRAAQGESDRDGSLVAQAVKLAQAGDRDALAFIYARYSEDIYGYVRSIVHDHHEAEDITQQVFAKLIGAIGSYQQRQVPFFAWMLRVARNAAIDNVRKQRLIPVEEVRANARERRRIRMEHLHELSQST